MANKKLFWSESFFWKSGSNGIIIDNKEYDLNEFFPRLYFLTQDGCNEDEIVNSFPDCPKNRVIEVINFLKSIGVLINSVQMIDEIFKRQYKYYQDKENYPENLILNKNLVEKFHNQALNRQLMKEDDMFINLESMKWEKTEFHRKSAREFDVTSKVSFNQLSSLLNHMRQENIDDKIFYSYPSAGGLYPIDIYLYVKHDRVCGVESGIYEYLPKYHSLKFISKNSVSSRAHYYNNKSIFAQSAFSMYFFYDTNASMPKYHGLGYYYAIIDLGIMLGKLSDAAENEGLGSCIIGVFDYAKAIDCFLAKENKKYLHCMEFGIPAKQ